MSSEICRTCQKWLQDKETYESLREKEPAFFDESRAEQVEHRGEQVFSRGIVNRWCGICGQGLHVEHGRTSFNTMDEALPYIKAIERANLLARSMIGGKF